jgi:hypothetical protein
MVSGAAPSKAKMLVKARSPVSGRLSTSARGYSDPEVGSVPNTDFFSDSFVSWLRRISSLVMVFLVARSTASLNPPGPPLVASHLTTLHPAGSITELPTQRPELTLGLSFRTLLPPSPSCLAALPIITMLVAAIATQTKSTQIGKWVIASLRSPRTNYKNNLRKVTTVKSCAEG